MRELGTVIKLMVTEKKNIFLAIVFGFLAAISSVGLMGTGGYLISQAALQPPLYTLTITIVSVRFFGLARAGARYVERYVSHKATFSILGKLRVYFYDKMEPLAPAIFMNYRSGDILSRVVADVESLQYFFLRVVYPPLVMLVVFLATGILLLTFSWQMAIALIGGLLIVGILLPALLTYATKNNGYQLRHKRSELSSQATEFFFGFVDLKMNRQLKHKQSELEHTSRELIKEQEKNSNITGVGESLALVGSFLTAWVVLIIGIVLVEAGHINGVFLAMLVLVALTVFEAATPVAALPSHLEESRIAASRLFNLTGQQPIQLEQQLIQDVDDKTPVPIAFQNVHFAYPNEERKALQGINYTLEPGKKVAIVGPSGSGKSSIVNLLLKYYESFEGSIRLGEIELANYTPEAARQFFGVVSQANHFFHASVRQNLLLAKPQATDEELAQVLAQVQLEHISLDDILSEKGASLSGGERQRLAIARMILKDAPMLLLDEPTTGLDSITEQEVLSVLWPQIAKKSVIYITHRLVGLEKMDEILVINKGQIIEQGSFAELMHNQGYFYQLKQLEAERIG
ncbi:thiol reductant ABC exporter subunit CydC [Desulfuribacillus alkaliarsenatis]|uniref:Thiol reductant ABC exporter subunit CydC n=1 Tax=Desulfuribacillus alkaliarsenatis TaxID=766136 RepID=A0A1E5G3H5_9FIRM|nr:thiol reductant ABC exporter subunit CydC [Desulfuribacillus alkaliarsenatis]OEF97619.1 thiol reductant ABC exporter subunit CydC [Desulfuribacillus alkaliarsenatis]